MYVTSSMLKWPGMMYCLTLCMPDVNDVSIQLRLNCLCMHAPIYKPINVQLVN